MPGIVRRGYVMLYPAKITPTPITIVFVDFELYLPNAEVRFFAVFITYKSKETHKILLLILPSL